MQFGVKTPNVITYNNVGLTSSVLKYENSWMEYFDPNWKKNQTFLKQSSIDFAQHKAYNTDGMNNYANNTNPALGGKPYPELYQYWNFFLTNEKI